MFIFLFLLDIFEKLVSDIVYFWWISNLSKRGMYWAKWEKSCCSKEEGGIRFRLIYEFDLILLVK